MKETTEIEEKNKKILYNLGNISYDFSETKEKEEEIKFSSMAFLDENYNPYVGRLVNTCGVFPCVIYQKNDNRFTGITVKKNVYHDHVPFYGNVYLGATMLPVNSEESQEKYKISYIANILIDTIYIDHSPICIIEGYLVHTPTPSYLEKVFKNENTDQLFLSVISQAEKYIDSPKCQIFGYPNETHIQKSGSITLINSTKQFTPERNIRNDFSYEMPKIKDLVGSSVWVEEGSVRKIFGLQIGDSTFPGSNQNYGTCRLIFKTHLDGIIEKGEKMVKDIRADYHFTLIQPNSGKPEYFIENTATKKILNVDNGKFSLNVPGASWIMKETRTLSWVDKQSGFLSWDNLFDFNPDRLFEFKQITDNSTVFTITNRGLCYLGIRENDKHLKGFPEKEGYQNHTSFFVETFEITTNEDGTSSYVPKVVNQISKLIGGQAFRITTRNLWDFDRNSIRNSDNRESLKEVSSIVQNKDNETLLKNNHQKK